MSDLEHITLSVTHANTSAMRLYDTIMHERDAVAVGTAFRGGYNTYAAAWLPVEEDDPHRLLLEWHGSLTDQAHGPYMYCGWGAYSIAEDRSVELTLRHNDPHKSARPDTVRTIAMLICDYATSPVFDPTHVSGATAKRAFSAVAEAGHMYSAPIDDWLAERGIVAGDIT